MLLLLRAFIRTLTDIEASSHSSNMTTHELALKCEQVD